MSRFVLASSFLAQLVVMSSVFLRLNNPEGDRWHELKAFGVGGVVEVTAQLEDSPVLEVKLANNEGEIIFSLKSDQERTKISTVLSNENVESSSLKLAELERVKVLVELQSEGVFVDLVGSAGRSVILPYPQETWSGNVNTMWEKVNEIRRVYIGGQDVNFAFLSGHVLVF